MLRQTIAELIVLFFCYSVAGWCMEVTLKYIQFHRFINRGFLIGPYCPIYVQVLRIRRDRLRPVINIAPVNACVRIIEA